MCSKNAHGVVGIAPPTGVEATFGLGVDAHSNALPFIAMNLNFCAALRIVADTLLGRTRLGGELLGGELLGGELLGGELLGGELLDGAFRGLALRGGACRCE